MRCLLIDIGNTRTSVALGAGSRVWGAKYLDEPDNRSTTLVRSLRQWMGGVALGGAVISSVVPSAIARWRKALQQLTDSSPVIVGHRLKLNVRLDYPKPSTIGGDRIANACGALDRYGAPVIVADFGTALTFDVLSGDGAYVGGVIAPGLSMMTDYLTDRTALLPRLSLKGRCHSIGRSTEGAMRIGARIGYRGMVREVVQYLENGLDLRGCTLCATGGFARWALGGSGMPFVFDPMLTFRGLLVIHELNRASPDGGGARATGN